MLLGNLRLESIQFRKRLKILFPPIIGQKTWFRVKKKDSFFFLHSFIHLLFFSFSILHPKFF